MKQKDDRDAMVVAASAVAIGLAKGKSRREIDNLVLFFSCVITNLSALSGQIIAVEET